MIFAITKKETPQQMSRKTHPSGKGRMAKRSTARHAQEQSYNQTKIKTEGTPKGTLNTKKHGPDKHQLMGGKQLPKAIIVTNLLVIYS